MSTVTMQEVCYMRSALSSLTLLSNHRSKSSKTYSHNSQVASKEGRQSSESVDSKHYFFYLPLKKFEYEGHTYEINADRDLLVSREDSCFFINIPELDITSYGESISESLDMLYDYIDYLWDQLVENKSLKLGPRAIKQKEYLTKLVTRTNG